MKIKSITDVITNSSSEVFTIHNSTDVDNIKQVINEILKIGESKYTCDDLFNIAFEWDYNELNEYWEDYHTDYEEFENIESPTNEQLEEFGWFYINNSYEGSIPEVYLNITAKNGQTLNPLLRHFGDMFAQHEHRYC